MSKPDIVSAGAVVLRRRPDLEVLVVHRPRYDDWSLPKGKLDPHEHPVACAVREVAEETGVRIRLSAPLGCHSYPVTGGTKHVHWWAGEVVREHPRVPDHEVDEVRWWSISEATRRLSYADECARMHRAAAQPPTTPLLLMRHAKAVARSDWTSSDLDRPLTEWGHRQARALSPILAAFGVRRVVTSPAARCLESVLPYARDAAIEPEARHELTEDAGAANPDAVAASIRQLRAETAESGVPTVVCGHRPVLPTMLAALDLANEKFATAALLTAYLTPDHDVHGVDRLTA